MKAFYLSAQSLEKAQWLAERYGPDVWYLVRESAWHNSLHDHKVFKVTINVTEDDGT